VTDNLAGLIWLKNADCFGLRNWNEALSDCNGLSSGLCELTDGSNIGDWRLPNRRELFSLLDDENHTPALPLEHPFTNVQLMYYWSSTTIASITSSAWGLLMYDGYLTHVPKDQSVYVWPVRGRQ